MNEYVISGGYRWIGMHGSQLIFMSETDALEAGGYMLSAEIGPYYLDVETPHCCLVEAGVATSGNIDQTLPGEVVTIGGNFSDTEGITPNLGYGAYFVQRSVATVTFYENGNFCFAAQTGAISNLTNAQDCNQLIYAANYIDTELDKYVPSEASVFTAQDVSAIGIRASGRLTFLGSLNGNIVTDAYGTILNGFINMQDGSDIETCESEVIRAVGASGATLEIENNFAGFLIASGQALIDNASGTAVLNNTVAAIGFAATSGFTTGGYFGGNISAYLVPCESAAPEDETGSGGESSGGESSGSAIVASNTIFLDDAGAADLSGNRAEVYGITASAIALGGDVIGTIYCEAREVIFECDFTDAAFTTQNNVLDNVAYNASDTIGIAGNFTGTISLFTQGIQFLSPLISDPDFVNDDNYANTYGFRAQTLTVGKNLRGSINVTAFDLAAEGLHYNVNYATAKTYGIYASTLTVAGGISSNIKVYAMEFSELSAYCVTAGIGVVDLTAQYIDADISILATAGAYRSVGIWVDHTMTSENDGIIDFSGSIKIAGDYGIRAGMMGFSGTLNLRINGTIDSDMYALVAGMFNPDGTFTRYGTDDYVELAAGAKVTGYIQLSNGKNTIILDSNAAYTGQFFTSLGTLNLMYNLNEDLLVGDPLSDNVIATLIDDSTLLASTTNITINLNDAEVGKGYALAQIATFDAEKWKSRELTFTYQGTTNKVTIGKTFTSSTMTISTAFTDGLLTFTVDYLKANEIAAPTLGVVEQNLDEDTITLNWQALANTDQYELEYSINGNKSIVVWVDGKTNQLELKLSPFDSGSEISWRVRQHISNNYLVSEWSSVGDFTIVSPDDDYTNPGSALFDTSPGTGANTSVVQLDWSNASCLSGVAYYEVRYFQTGDIVDPDWSSMTETTGNQTSISTYATKKITDNSVTVSGLNNLEYVYWQVRAVGNNGTTYDWVDGQTMRIYAGDTEGPEFDTASVVAIVDFNASLPKDRMMTVTVTWDPAVDADGKSGVGGYDISYRIAGTDTWTVVNCTYNTTSCVLNLANGVYEWKFAATDFAGNRSAEYNGGYWLGDYQPPEFTYGPNLEAEVSSAANKSNDILLTWNPAVEAATTVSAQAGMKEYILYYKLSTEADSTAKKVVLTDMPTSYTMNSLTNNLADGSYSWWLEAYDNVDNVTKTDSSTFLVDTSAPTGGVDGEVSGPIISATVIENITSSTDPLGYPYVETTYEVTSVTVEITIPGEFTDASPIYYLIQCSADNTFTNVVEYKVAYTEEKTKVLWDNSMDMAVGALAKMGKVYYRFQAVDEIGNSTGAWLKAYSYFDMIDPITGQKLVDTDNPAFSSGTVISMAREDENLTFSWAAATDVFGVKEYQLKFTAKSGGKSITVTGVDEQKYTTSSLADGIYTCSVRAVDWYGHVSDWISYVKPNTNDYTFVVDVTAPVFDLYSLQASVLNRDICLAWDKATDSIELAGYEITYGIWSAQAGGFTQWMTYKNVDPEDTSLWFNNWADGRYSFMIRAYDTAGNYTSWSDQVYATVNTANDPGGSFSTAKLLEWNIEFSNLVGRTDTADYIKYALTSSASVTITVSNVWSAENNGAGVKATIYDGSGNKLKEFSISDGATNSASVLVDASKGQYCYVVITPSKSDIYTNVANYTVSGEVNYFPAASSNSSFEKATTVNLNSSGLGSFSGWVGFGDPSDFFKLSGASAGTLQYIEATGLESSITVSLYDADQKLSKTYTISSSGKYYFSDLVAKGGYMVVTSGDKGAGSKNSDYNISVKLDYFPAASSNSSFETAAAITLGTEGTGSANGWVGYGDPSDYFKVVINKANTLDFLSISGISSQVQVTIYDADYKAVKTITTNKNGQLFSDVLLEGTYYISVTSGDNGKGAMNTSYEISLADTYLPDPTTNHTFATATSVTLNASGAASFGDWVGYGNTACYYLVNASGAGAADISISGLTGKVQVTIYSADRKQIKSVTTSDTKVLFSDLLLEGNFYVSVTTTDPNKGTQNTEFTVNVNDEYFPTPTSNNSIATAEKVTLTNLGTTSFSGWVGYGDPADYFQINGEAAGAIQLSISGLGANATIAIYDEYGKQVKSIKATSSSSILLDNYLVQNKFYVSVTSGDNGKGKMNTGYTVSIQDSYFPAPSGNSDFNTAKAVTLTVDENLVGTASVSGWVGYGDPSDYYKITPANAGSLSVSISGLESKAKVSIYDANGKTIKSASVSGSGVVFSNLLVSGAFYISVVSGDNGKGKMNTDYTVDVTDKMFPAATDNNTFRTATTLTPNSSGIFTTTGWVGYGDAADYYLVDATSAGTLTLSLKDVEAGVKVAIYNADGKQLKTVSVSSSGTVIANLLTPGKFYVTVTSGDGGKGRQNTGYEIDGGIAYFPQATDNNSFVTATAITADASGNLAANGWVGYGDAANYYVFNATGAGNLNYLTISNISGKINVTVYNENQKKIASTTTSSNGNLFNDVLFSGKFYIVVTSGDNGKGKENTDYSISGNEAYFPAATDNNKLSTATVVNLADTVGSIATVDQISGTATVEGWVGYGDAIDYYKFIASDAGTLSLEVSGLEATAKVTVYDANGKQIANRSGSGELSLAGLLCAGNFYVSVESGDKGKGKMNTGYTVNVNDEYFPTPSGNSGFATAAVTVLDDLGIGEATGWVGYGDAADYYLVSATGAGELSLSISGLEGSVKVTIYDANRKQLKSISMKQDGTVIADLLVPGAFYVSVTSGDNGKGKMNTGYTISIDDDYFPAATDNNSFATASKVTPDEAGKSQFAGWVGYGDAVDYYLVGATMNGSADIAISGLEGSVKVTIYDANKKQIKSVSAKSDTVLFSNLLLEGGFYVSVTSGDNGKGKQNTGYSVNVDESYFPAPTGNNSFNNATVIALDNGTGTTDGWVGYGDAADYYRFTAAGAGLLSVEVTGLEAKAKVSVYDASTNKKLAATSSNGSSCSFSDLLATGNFYVVVESGDNGKGKENTGYTVNVSDAYFPAPSGNTSFSTAQAIDFNQSGTKTVDGWVGYNDAADYYKLDMPYDGYTSISISGITSKTVVTVYDENGKKLESASVTADGMVFSGDSSAGYGYISVASGDNGKGKMNTDYTLSITADFVVPESGHNTIGSALALDLSSGSDTEGGAVGVGNQVNFYSFQFGESGSTATLSLDLADQDLEIGSDVLWTLYDSEGNQYSLTSGEITEDFESGVYYASVEMKTAKKFADYAFGVAVK